MNFECGGGEVYILGVIHYTHHSQVMVKIDHFIAFRSCMMTSRAMTAQVQVRG